MGVGATIAGVSGLLGAANSASQLFGGGGGGTGGYYSGAGVPPTYIPSGQSSADLQYQSLASDMAKYAPQLSGYVFPTAMGLTQDVISNPYGAQAVGGAQTAASYGTGTLAPMQTGAATTLQGLGTTAAQYAPQILQTGFDPQQALYNRTQQQIQDQVNAINAMYGVSSSPYGAGVANKALSDFNIDWQNQQLQRQIQAAQGYGNLASTAGREFAGASDLGTAGMGTYAQSAGLPYSALQNIYGTQLGALGNLNTIGTGAAGLDQNTLNALAAYMKLGQSATGIGQAGAAQQFQNQQTLGQGFGQGLAQLGGALPSNLSLANLFGGGSSSPFGNFQGTIGGFDPLFGYGGSAQSYDPYALAGAF